MSYDGIRKSLDDVERKLGKANKIAAKGDGMNYKDAIKLGTKSNSITSTIKKGIKEYSAFDPTEEQAKQLLSQMTTIVKMTEEQLDSLVANSAHFQKLKVGGLVKRNVVKTEQASKDLSELMVGKAPGSVKSDAEALEKRRAAAFQKALGTYQNATGGEDEPDVEDDSD